MIKKTIIFNKSEKITYLTNILKEINLKNSIEFRNKFS